jgi:plasmid maintenance system killer protein
MGKPDCWCGTNTVGMSGTAAWKFQCYGDADNKTQDISGKYRVYTNDYWKIVSNWRKKISDTTLDACADFDHKSQDISGKYRVYTNDYWKMVSNWRKKDSQFTGSGNCPTG